jgi:hypothetical protein
MTAAGQTRKIGGTGWNLWRGLVGTAYLVAAGFNLFFTLPEGDLGWSADSAWFPFLASFVRGVVVPNHELFMVLVVIFEIAVGLLILSRNRYVDLGVAGSVLWVLFLIPFLQPFPMAATNVVLAILQGVLLLRRYDTPIWELLGSLLGPLRRRG